MLHRICAFSIALFLSVSPVLAGDWLIAKVSGEAWIVGPNVPAVRAASGMTVPDGATFSTGHNARAKLERGAETIMVSPNSTLSPRHSSFFGTTTIQQQVGRAEYDVEKRNVRHFSVETPFLAAVVKGTRFTVSVSGRAADVKVDRGLVEVSDPRTGAAADVAAGQRATVNSSSDQGLQVKGKDKESRVQPQTEVLRSSHHEVGKSERAGGNSSAGNAPGGNAGNNGSRGGDKGGASGNSGGKGDSNSGGKGDAGSGGKGGNGSNGAGNSGGGKGGGNTDGGGGRGNGNAGGSGNGNGSGGTGANSNAGGNGNAGGGGKGGNSSEGSMSGRGDNNGGGRGDSNGGGRGGNNAGGGGAGNSDGGGRGGGNGGGRR